MKAGIYKHNKGGKLYEVLHNGLLEVNLEPVVIYASLENGTVWVRPMAEFKERFTFIKSTILPQENKFS